MRIGIDASNIRGGGGLVHLRRLLEQADPDVHFFQFVTVWGGEETTKALSFSSPAVRAVYEPDLDRGLAQRMRWRSRRLNELVGESADLLFIPGGLGSTSTVPWVSMSQNLVPFDSRERIRYRFGRERLRVEALRWAQSRAFEGADGVIFLTDYARLEICRQLRRPPNRVAVIPHGIDQRFRRCAGGDSVGERVSLGHPLRLLYVSTVNAYKHQWHVADAVWRLRQQGYPLKIAFVGKGYEPWLSKLRRITSRLDPNGDWVTHHGCVPFERVHELYHTADAFIFASSCENMPNILLEAMASGLPIACSDRGPMPEVLCGGGIYFDPESPDSIAHALRKLLISPERRREIVNEALARASQFSWERCALETFAFLHEVYLTSRGECGGNDI